MTGEERGREWWLGDRKRGSGEGRLPTVARSSPRPAIEQHRSEVGTASCAQRRSPSSAGQPVAIGRRLKSQPKRLTCTLKHVSRGRILYVAAAVAHPPAHQLDLGGGQMCDLTPLADSSFEGRLTDDPSIDAAPPLVAPGTKIPGSQPALTSLLA